MQLRYTIIYVRDVQATLDFYQKAFGLKLKMLSDSKLYGELQTGDTLLAFCDESYCLQNGLQFTKNRSDATAPGFEIGFTTDDVEGAYKHAVAEGAVALQEPILKPWGQTVAYVRDINGIIVELCNPVQY